MPWKNGGGHTEEIARAPGDPPPWRISLASIERDGPFSDFGGYDRTIVPVEGAGFSLAFEHETVRLDRLGEPFRFAGEARADCRLIAGASRDLNVMTRRGSYDHAVAALELYAGERRELAGEEEAYVFACAPLGAATAADRCELGAGDTLCLARNERAVLLAAANALVLRISLRRC